MWARHDPSLLAADDAAFDRDDRPIQGTAAYTHRTRGTMCREVQRRACRFQPGNAHAPRLAPGNWRLEASHSAALLTGSPLHLTVRRGLRWYHAYVERHSRYGCRR